jgi:hypothetical protein
MMSSEMFLHSGRPVKSSAIEFWNICDAGFIPNMSRLYRRRPTWVENVVMVPVLFLIMINDLLSEWPDRWKYVDDCTLTECIPPHIKSNLQDLVDYICNWTIANNMKLNVDKCNEMIIDFSKEKRNFTPLLINDVPVKRVESTRILGTTFQVNMNWNDHIHQIVRKAGKRLYMLRILKRSNANLKILLTVSTSIIRPVLEYAAKFGILIFNNT